MFGRVFRHCSPPRAPSWLEWIFFPETWPGSQREENHTGKSTAPRPIILRYTGHPAHRVLFFVFSFFIDAVLAREVLAREFPTARPAFLLRPESGG
jgi:hypothetical protein